MHHHSARRWMLPLALLAVSVPATSQVPADVLRIYEPFRKDEIRLIDSNSNLVHSWPTTLWRNGGIDLHSDGTLYRGVLNPPENGAQRLALDGTFVWGYRNPPGYTTHHDIEVLPNGNLLMISEDFKTRAEAISQGRSPATVGAFMLPDAIIEVQPTGFTSGVIVWEWHIWDHLVQDFDPTRANYGVVPDHPELVDVNFPVNLYQGEFTHMNGIDYDPIHDWIVMSSPVHNEIWIIDHSTTTAEAAGHSGGRWGKGGDLLYRWGNPSVYRAGPASAKVLDFQHDPRFIPPGYPGEGNVTIFSNNPEPGGPSTVYEIVLPVDPSGNFIKPAVGPYGPAAPVWSYTAPGFYSEIMSSAERLPNGNTLICSGKQGWLFEVTPAGQKVWEHFENVGTHSLFHAIHTRRSLWGDQETIPASSGGLVLFDLIAGTPRANDLYVILGSASGTSPGFSVNGVNVPLNLDGYLTSVFGSLGRGVFAGWVGTLDSLGRAGATYTLPPLPFLTGLTLHHAGLVIDPSNNTVVFASNAVPLTFTP